MAKISEETIKQIRESNDIVDVIGSYIELKPKGKNYFCVCPFHDDHSPSMSVSKEKQIFRCFVCETSGNVITFIEDYLKVSFIEALDILGKRAGINLNIKEEKKDSPYKELYDIYNIALSYYKNNLNSKEGETARKYLNERKLDKETIDYFDIGLSINGGLVGSLSKKYSAQKLKDIGLMSANGNDLFRNRIMFTLKDNEGNPVGFSARIYDKNSNEPKYINTPETVIFKKGSIFYNYHRAKDFIRKKHEIIISEGQMEIIRMHTIGIDNAVALMGTSFTKEHLNIIKNLKCKVVLNLDQDEAGKNATITIGEMLVKEGIVPEVIIFSGSKDADEYIIKNGQEAFMNAYKSRVNYFDFKLNYLKKGKDLKNDADISKYINESIDAINEIDDDILRELKIKSLSEEFNISIDLIKSRITNKNIKIQKEYKPIPKKIIYNKYDKSELRILYLMMVYPELIDKYENNLGYLNNENRKRLAGEIINYKNRNKTFDISDFICYTTNREDLNLVMNEVLTYNKSDEYTTEELEDYYLRVKEFRVKRQIDTLTEKMKNTLDQEEKMKLASRIANMKKEVLKW